MRHACCCVIQRVTLCAECEKVGVVRSVDPCCLVRPLHEGLLICGSCMSVCVHVRFPSLPDTFWPLNSYVCVNVSSLLCAELWNCAAAYWSRQLLCLDVFWWLSFFSCLLRRSPAATTVFAAAFSSLTATAVFCCCVFGCLLRLAATAVPTAAPRGCSSLLPRAAVLAAALCCFFTLLITFFAVQTVFVFDYISRLTSFYFFCVLSLL